MAAGTIDPPGRLAGTRADGRWLGTPTPGLVGRRDEQGVLEGLLTAARDRQGRALIVRGEAGVGKSALLEWLVGAAAGVRVARAAGVESEMELAFASLHLLCAPLLGRAGDLPGPQRDALGAAFGLREGGAPDRFLVGLAVLTLLSAAARERPLLCIVDDAQWLDRASAQVLAFVARRLPTEPVGLVLAGREPGEELAGLAELEIAGLPRPEARSLLGQVVGFELDERVREKILAEANGNPLALLELCRSLGPAQLTAGPGLAGTPPAPARVEAGFARRLEALPDDTRALMLIAAAEPAGDPVLVWRAAERLGVPASAASAAAADGLLQIGALVRFRHPLVRSAVYSGASLPDRRAAHLALAEVTDRGRDPDRRAWHLAAAATGPQEEAAAELERSVGRARARGGLAAAAGFWQRAVELTADPARRADRALAAATAQVQAGAPDAALGMLGLAEAGPLSAAQRAHASLIRAQIAFASDRGNAASPLLLAAARRLEGIDAGRAREAYLEAVSAALFAGHLASPGADVLAVSRAAREAPSPPHPVRAPDRLLDGLAATFREGYRAGLPALRQALDAFGEQMSPVEELRWLWLAGVAALNAWDDARWEALSRRHVQLAREAGAVGELPLALSSRALTLLFTGELAAAVPLAEQARTVTAATDGNLAPYGALGAVALRGRETEATALIRDAGWEAAQRGEGAGVTFTNWASAVLHNSLGRHDEALAAAERGSADQNELGLAPWCLTELIEAAARAGQPGRASAALRILSEITSAAGTDWALGTQARSRALLADSGSAEQLYLEAIERLGRTRVRTELARAHLLYGEWLRRAGRRADAREQLRESHAMLEAMGADAFAERARRELQAAGETVRKQAVEENKSLTAQEAQVARLAAEGHTNPEIGARLFISSRTAEYHLHKVFSKLGISSRRQLRQCLAQLEPRTA
jgi:DNA-binding CsgD family transcriptional regulator